MQAVFYYYNNMPKVKQEPFSILFARFSLFLVYFWFGILKVFDLSPATPLVNALQEQTLPFIQASQFIFLFGIFEVLIGIGFLIRRFTKVVFYIFLFHMATTIMPLFVLPQVVWVNSFIPTLEGQYIIKNIVLISLALFIYQYHEKKK